jgi:hypothetical protein
MFVARGPMQRCITAGQTWCAILGLNQSRLAKRRRRLRLICYLRTFVVPWTLAEQSAPGQLVAFVEQLVGRRLDGSPPCSRIDQRTAARSRSSESMASRSRMSDSMGRDGHRRNSRSGEPAAVPRRSTPTPGCASGAPSGPANKAGGSVRLCANVTTRVTE